GGAASCTGSRPGRRSREPGGTRRTRAPATRGRTRRCSTSRERRCPMSSPSWGRHTSDEPRRGPPPCSTGRMTSPRIEDHALLSDQRTTALVTREGDVDWLCLPRFASDAVFCSLLGTEDHGHWSLRIADGEVVSRRYLPGTMVLETQWRSP